MSNTEYQALEEAFLALHRDAQRLAYVVAVRPQPGDDWEPVRDALDALLVTLDQVTPA
jgi:hypothetical protein